MAPTLEEAFAQRATAEDLRRLYKPPVKVVAEKKMDTVEPWCRTMIESARFVFVATADRDGRPTVSPKGGREGFVAVLDEQRLAVPDYPGNNLIDGLRNIVDNPSIGLIFVTPGRSETLRVDGAACVTTDPDVLERARGAEHRPPKSAIGVVVRSVFFHCPASFNRAGLWRPDSWRDDVGEPFDDVVRASLPRDEWPPWAFEDGA